MCVLFPATEPKAGFRTKLRRLAKYETKFELVVSIQNDFFSVERKLILCVANSKQDYKIWASETCLTLYAFIFFARCGTLVANVLRFCALVRPVARRNYTLVLHVFVLLQKNAIVNVLKLNTVH